MTARYRLRRKTDGGVSSWPLREGDNVVGRGIGCEVQLRDPSVSRRHALIRVASQELKIEDLGSRNGSWLNGEPLHQTEPLRPGDRVQIGDVVLDLLDESAPVPEAASSVTTRLHWDEVRAGSESTEAGAFWEAVMEAARFMVLPGSLDQLLPSLLDLVASVVPAERIILLLWHEETDQLEPVASRPPLIESEPLPLSKTLVDAVVRNRESILLEDATNDPQFAGSHSIAALKLRSAMAVPLFDNERVIGLVHAHDVSHARRFDRRQLQVFTMLANLIAIKITNARLLEEHRVKQRLEHEMAAAGMIQRRILQSRLPSVPGYELAARLLPCRETAGDFYDVRPLPDGRVLFAVGDVSGKGSGAALLTSLTLSALRVLAAEGLDIDVLGERLNQHVSEASEAIHFVTLWLGALDPAAHRLTYLNAGHNPPFLLGGTAPGTRLTRTGLPIGMLPDAVFGTADVSLPPGGLLCVYTDGLVEANQGEDLFGDERLLGAFSRHRSKTLEALTDGVFQEVQDYQEGDSLEDDCTVLLLRRRD